MNDKIKNALAKKNNCTEARYKESVRKNVADTFDKADELAILRKAVAMLFDVVSTFHPVDNAEFKDYNAKIEAIKSEVKESLGISLSPVSEEETE